MRCKEVKSPVNLTQLENGRARFNRGSLAPKPALTVTRKSLLLWLALSLSLSFYELELDASLV